MKKDILCYLLLIVSVVLFIYTYIFLEPIELIQIHDELEDENIEIDAIYEYSLENVKSVEEIYNGQIVLANKWLDFIPLFTAYKEEFISKYELYNGKEATSEKNNYERETYLRYGINLENERNELYNKFKGTTNIVKITVIDNTIENIENGTSFDIKAIDDSGKEHIFNCIILNDLTADNVYLKILPKLIN